MHDGQFAHNAWLQELPDPITKIVWDNAALVSPATAKNLKLENGDVVNLKFHGRYSTCADLDFAGTGKRLRDGASRLRPGARGKRRKRGRF